MALAYARIQSTTGRTTAEYDTTDEDAVLFVGVGMDGECEMFTANELRDLADAMDKWQDMNVKGGS